METLAAVDLNLLVALDALLAERNVTRAGARIGLSQSAMSKALARLRALFGDPLLVRTADRMVPTARAMALVEPLHRALGEVRRVIDRDAAFNPASMRRTVTLASADMQDLLILPDVIAHLRRAAPGIDLRVRASDRIDVVTALQSGEVDLGLMPMMANTSDLRSAVLFREELVVLVARGHDVARKGLTLKRFLAYPHIMVSVEGRGTAPVDAALAARGLQRRIGLTLQHFLPVPFVVAASDMIAAYPARLARILAANVPVAVLPLPLPIEGATVHVAWHRRHDADPLLLWLRERLVEHDYDRSVPPLVPPNRKSRGSLRPRVAYPAPRRRNR
ncbi:LysR family transcriptional regulator [Reyranella sp. CPCC 100927]|uniref:LysR family transcriptional regulator n=1 Tax=Reyranella sp. CPCC 100927 TaxID=2599616 RepID=UPI0015B419C7|nr:LysR family transcriptional regulator [Reyranella sp. CPCC 100927]